jgi:hypothetical protein
MSVPIDVSSIEVLLHGQSTHTHSHTHALALSQTRRRCVCGKSLNDCFLPPPHRGISFHGNQLKELPPGIFSGLTSLR